LVRLMHQRIHLDGGEGLTDAWRAVFVPNQALFVGLPAVFELIVGVLFISGARRTQVGLVAARGSLPGYGCHLDRSP
jgi:hypothetical protein